MPSPRPRRRSPRTSATRRRAGDGESFYKLHKYEWMKKLWEMMQANGASNAERPRYLPAARHPPRSTRRNVPGHVPLFKRPTKNKPDDAVSGATSGAVPGGEELHRCDPGLRARGQPLQPGFAKAVSKPGGARPGRQASTKRRWPSTRSPDSSSQIMPTRCSTSASSTSTRTRCPEHDTSSPRKYRDSVPAEVQADDGIEAIGIRPGGGHIAEAQDKIKKEEKRLDRLKKQQERETAGAVRRGGRRREEGRGGRGSGPARRPRRLPPPPRARRSAAPPVLVEESA